MAAAQDIDTGPVVDGPGHSDLRRNRRHDGRYADDDQHCGYEKNVAVDEANLRLGKLFPRGSEGLFGQLHHGVGAGNRGFRQSTNLRHNVLCVKANR